MLTILATTGRLLATRWPHLLVWYLAGWLTHYVIIEVAAFFGASSALLGIAIMPLAILARLVSFVGMFFVLRDAMPAYQSLLARGEDDSDLPALPGRQRMSEVLLVSILPFFAFYTAWKFLAEDTQHYAQSALANLNPFDGPVTGNVLDLQVNTITIIVIVIAFVLRLVIKKNEAVLPRWSALVAVYLEALWVYLTVLVVNNYSGQFNDWVGSRAAVHWYEDARQWLIDGVAPLGWAWSVAETVVAETSALVLLPLAWLTIAGVVYGKALKASIAYRPRHQYYTRLRAHFDRLPKALVRRGSDLSSDFASRWRPLANALTLIWRAGAVAIGLYVLAYTVLEAAKYWILLGATRLIGPHPLHSWWFNFDDMLSFCAALLIEPLRIVIIAASYDYCLRQLAERREKADDADLTTTPTADTEAAPR